MPSLLLILRREIFADLALGKDFVHDVDMTLLNV
jgi:hypothetical protein